MKQFVKANWKGIGMIFSSSRKRRLMLVLLTVLMVTILALSGVVYNQYLSLSSDYRELERKYNNLTQAQDSLKTAYDQLQNAHNELKTSYEALKADYETLQQEAILPPYTIISGRNVTWAFKLSNGELHTLHMPIDYYRDEISLEKPQEYLHLTDYHSQTWKIMDFRPFIDYGSFDTFIPEIYDQIGNDEQFIYEMWNIVAQLTVYSSEITETPRWPLETLTEAGGDCEDTAILVASLLQEIQHFVVELVYIDSNNPLDPHTFNHVIVWVDTGTYQTYIETTSKTTMNPYLSGVHGWGFEV